MRYVSRLLSEGSDRMRDIAAAQWGLLSSSVNLLASVCYPFPSVLAALSEPSQLLPAEGMPRARYLPGSAVMDKVEMDAERLLLQLFGASSGYRATIQPHSGTQANQIAFNAVLRKDNQDLVLCLAPSDGGHISHSVLVGRRNPVMHYPLDASGAPDLQALAELARRQRPRLIVAGGSACPRAIDFAAIAGIAREVGAYLHADISHTAPFIAAGRHPPVIEHADFITFNMVKNLRGPNGGVLIYRDQHHNRVARALFPGTQGGANENMMLAKLAALDEWTRHDIRIHADRMISAARTIGDELLARGFQLVTGGTDSHLLLVDLRNEGRTGAEVEAACERGRVLVNRNLVPGDTTNPVITSGFRIGAACVSVLGYSDADLCRLAGWIADRALGLPDSDDLITQLTARYNISSMPG